MNRTPNEPKTPEEEQLKSNPILNPLGRVAELQLSLHTALKTKGLLGISEKIETARSRNHIDASFWGILKFFGIPAFTKDMERLEKELPTKGIGQVSREILEKLGVRVSTKAPEWTKQEGTPILFYGNHRGFVEPELFASQCTRDDITFVGNEFVRKIGANISKYFLPVMARRYAKDSRAQLNAIEKGFMGERTMTTAEIEEMNKSSITEAAQRIEKGGAVGIFPTPGLDIRYAWFSGIGKIIRSLPPSAFPHVRLAPIHFEDVNPLDLARAVRRRYKKNKTPREITAEVKFGSPRSLKDLGINENMTDKEITDILQRDYLREFTESDQ